MESTETVGLHGGPSAGWIEALRGVHGRLGLEMGETLAAVLEVGDGRVELKEGAPPFDAKVRCQSGEDLRQVLRGELDMVVAALQGRLALEGDAVFAIKTLRGLRAQSPFAAQQQAEGG